MAKKKLTKKQYKDKEKKNEAKKKQTELALPKIPKLSQSLVKSLYNYKIGEECGLKIEASYINGINFPATEVQELGNYFEYICTNQLPRDGHTPVAKLLKTGKPTTSYLRMDKQKENYLNIMKSYNLKVEKTGFVFTNPKYSGIADIIALDKNIKSKDKNKQRVIIDIKTSGLINDKWSPYGWANESIEEKWDLLIQAVHYKMLAKYEWGIEDIPFYFMVFSNKNEVECKIFEINIDEATKFQHYQNLENIKKYLDQIMKTGWEAKPELMRCSKCPMNDTCLYQLEVPKIQKVYV
jgi:hypothetical protein|tara:strand:- start:2744 stop:3628 length:885 start_codon:yes stop_codon:yes gene_type:complete